MDYDDDYLTNVEYNALNVLIKDMPTAFDALPEYMQKAYHKRHKHLLQLADSKKAWVQTMRNKRENKNVSCNCG